nr:hypothetical protein [uncultured Mediterraneibacter sp.]
MWKAVWIRKEGIAGWIGWEDEEITKGMAKDIIETIQQAYQQALRDRFKKSGMTDEEIMAKDCSINIQDEWRQYIK